MPRRYLTKVDNRHVLILRRLTVTALLDLAAAIAHALQPHVDLADLWRAVATSNGISEHE
ncbi:MAG: hypothetical protein ACRCTR_07125 [Actinomycetota bacterium]